MASKTSRPRKRAVPQRTCIACREQEGKRALVRVVRGPNGVEVDPTGKLSGRGAYLHPTQDCWAHALENRSLQRALRTAITPAEMEQLQAFARGLPAGQEADAEDQTA